MKTALIKPKKQTHSQRAVSMTQDQVSEICEYLGWTQEQYFLHQYEQYEEFLRRAWFGRPEPRLNILRYSPIMRGLWNNEWIHRNSETFLPAARHLLFKGLEVTDEGELIAVEPAEGTREHVQDEYLFVHNGKLLVNNVDFLERFYHVLELINKS